MLASFRLYTTTGIKLAESSRMLSLVLVLPRCKVPTFVEQNQVHYLTHVLVIYFHACAFQHSPLLALSRSHNAELVLRKVHSWLSGRRVDLVLVLSPLRIVYAINPLLGLDHQTPEFRHIRGTIPMLLAHLDRDSAVEIVTRIELQTLLVGIDIQLNTSDIRVHREDADVCSFRRGVPGAVKDEGIIIACAVEATVIDCVEDISSNLFRRGKIERGAIDDADRTIRYFDIVDLHVARRVGHVECVVQYCQVRWIGESVKIPVDMVGKHDGGWFVERY